jgi:aminoglycoside phosphotransferase family enzyme/predicted kinase
MLSESSLDDQRRLVAALRKPLRHAPPPDELKAVDELKPPGEVELIETHISWVLLAGDLAYKIKKAVDLGFLDFRSLAERRRLCALELRVNRRTAPELYLAAVPIVGNVDSPTIGGEGAPIEWAVKMRRFDQRGLLDQVARRGELDDELIDALAAGVAGFHAAAAVAAADVAHGNAEAVAAPALENFAQLAPLASDTVRGTLDRLSAWTHAEVARLAGVFARRKAAGRVRECHGDLHLGNIVLIDGRPVPFDAIEFNESLRWIDVANDVSFLAMDLMDRGLAAPAWRFVNGWLEASGDYDAVAVLRFYLVYRAMVRAKVAAIRAHQPGLDRSHVQRVDREFHEYLALAGQLAGELRPALILMHGLSGSGKTTVAQQLLERLGAIRVRSDVERKRLHGLAPQERSNDALGAGLYAADASARTYDRLAAIAGEVLAAGYPVIVDAAFLHRGDRDRFRALAGRTGAPFVIASCVAGESTLRQRVAARAASGHDASDAGIAVLEAQLGAHDPVASDESAQAVSFDTDNGPDGWAEATQRLAAAAGQRTA